VGENLEDKDTPILIFSSAQGGANQLINAAFRKEFKELGFVVVEDENQADRIIGGAVIRFWATETRLYQTLVRLKVEVKERGGQVVFSRIYAGSAKRFGRSLSQDNYNETFSDAMIDLMQTLLGDEAFLKALG
jgi:hypothetical protein